MNLTGVRQHPGCGIAGTAPVITVAATASVGEVADVFRRDRMSTVPVTDEVAAVVGLVSDFDLLA